MIQNFVIIFLITSAKNERKKKIKKSDRLREQNLKRSKKITYVHQHFQYDT